MKHTVLFREKNTSGEERKQEKRQSGVTGQIIFTLHPYSYPYALLLRMQYFARIVLSSCLSEAFVDDYIIKICKAQQMHKFSFCIQEGVHPSNVYWFSTV